MIRVSIRSKLIENGSKGTSESEDYLGFIIKKTKNDRSESFISEPIIKGEFTYFDSIIHQSEVP